ncbi:MAG: ATP-binding protein [Gemmatimonadaceae bacterium]
MEVAKFDSDSFAWAMEHVEEAFAVIRGDRHTIVYANASFRRLLNHDEAPVVGRHLDEAFAVGGNVALTAMLNRAHRTGVGDRQVMVKPLVEGSPSLCCTVWSDVDRNHDTEHLVVELRHATSSGVSASAHREMIERLLLSALHDQDMARDAELSRRRAALLSAESRRLSASLDESATLVAMSLMSLPCTGDWCIVDTLDADKAMRRQATIHPDPKMQAALDDLAGAWMPLVDDLYGVGAALRSDDSRMLPEAVLAVLDNPSHSPAVRHVVSALVTGPLLTMPLIVDRRLIGAVTFVAGQPTRSLSKDDMALAKDLASLSALALDRAQLYGVAVALRARAESASVAKSAFLGMMSHELRTPLNAIGGYVELLGMEIHGPLTAEQRVDLDRIRTNQRYLTGLITDLLNLTKVGSGTLIYRVGDFDVRELLAESVALTHPLVAQKGLFLETVECDGDFVVSADREKVIQILVNLLSNSIKFTPSGRRIVADCARTDSAILVRVTDSGIGIPPEKLDVIFDPFVQVKSDTLGQQSGVGLGLAISQGLARGMHGDLTVESTLGEGSRFTLTLPIAATEGVG